MHQQSSNWQWEVFDENAQRALFSALSFCGHGSQVVSSSAYMETLSLVREVAEKVAATESGSTKDERAQVC